MENNVTFLTKCVLENIVIFHTNVLFMLPCNGLIIIFKWINKYSKFAHVIASKAVFTDIAHIDKSSWSPQ